MKAFQIVLLLLVAGCSSKEAESDKNTPKKSSKESILKYQIDSLEKAKGVEALIQSSADRTRQEIDK